MIHPDCFQKPWLDEQAQALRIHRDGTLLLEKCMVALELVGRLSALGLTFVFKGGTSLVLHLEPLRRLSIDADIITPEPLERVLALLAQAVSTPPFISPVIPQPERDRDSPPVRYFRVPYRSVADPSGASHVQLDVITAAHPYPSTLRRRVEPSFLRIEEPAEIELPSLEGLLGDKLTAFAPTTIGVLYEPPPNRRNEPGEPRPLRILKQLFDVHHLFAEATNLEQVAAAYHATFAIQNPARGGGFTLAQCLDDTVATARELCLTPSDRAGLHTPRQHIFRRGLAGLATHLVGEPFGLDRQARTAASRAALLATLIKHQMTHNVPRDIVRSVPPPREFRFINLTGENAALDPILRPIAPAALYLWSLIEEAEALARETP
ncbi:MAG TPA: nucleotidyl transferase AbiEii/AbiGii toxin family protein [Chthoniobacter sp.]|nr:nucleotidyl transferase AbiEii/AbiGii toxin family protein [Chthoniobacter sp.]